MTQISGKAIILRVFSIFQFIFIMVWALSWFWMSDGDSGLYYAVPSVILIVFGAYFYFNFTFCDLLAGNGQIKLKGIFKSYVFDNGTSFRIQHLPLFSFLFGLYIFEINGKKFRFIYYKNPYLFMSPSVVVEEIQARVYGSK